MAGYIGKQAVVLSTTAADVNGNADISGNLDVDGTTTLDGLTVDGNVGIGTSSPNSPLEVTVKSGTSGANSGIRLISSDGGGYAVYPTSAVANPVWNTNVNSSEQFSWSVGGSEKMRIDSSGKVGIGTSSPAEELDVNGSIGLSGKEIARRSGNNILLGDVNAAGGAGSVTLRTNGGDKLTINTSGNVGIGTSSPSAPFVVSNSGAEGLEFIPDSSANAALVQAYNRSTSSFIPIQLRGSQLEFNTGGTQRLRIDSDGLKFNGDTAAANALDDYEEGTWTPAISNWYTGWTSTTGATYSNAKYTKIGNLVHLHFKITGVAANTGRVYAYFSGLPFTPSETAYGFGVSSWYQGNGDNSGAGFAGVSTSGLVLIGNYNHYATVTSDAIEVTLTYYTNS